MVPARRRPRSRQQPGWRRSGDQLFYAICNIWKVVNKAKELTGFSTGWQRGRSKAEWRKPAAFKQQSGLIRLVSVSIKAGTWSICLRKQAVSALPIQGRRVQGRGAQRAPQPLSPVSLDECL